MGVRTWWKPTGVTPQLYLLCRPPPCVSPKKERERIPDLRKSSLLLASVLHTRHACGTGTLRITRTKRQPTGLGGVELYKVTRQKPTRIVQWIHRQQRKGAFLSAAVFPHTKHSPLAFCCSISATFHMYSPSMQLRAHCRKGQEPAVAVKG